MILKMKGKREILDKKPVFNRVKSKNRRSNIKNYKKTTKKPALTVRLASIIYRTELF